MFTSTNNNDHENRSKARPPHASKNGNKIVFEIMHSRCQTRFHSFQHGLGVVLDCKSIEECIERTFAKIDYLNAELVKRMISL